MDQTTAAEAPVIERELRIEASPEIVFQFWTDPARMAQWMGRTVTLDPRPGGPFRIDYNGSDIASGAFVEIDPPRRLVVTWGWEAEGDPVPPGASRVEVDFEPEDGGTRLRLRHLGLPADAIDGHAIGWDQFLPNLQTAVTR